MEQIDLIPAGNDVAGNISSFFGTLERMIAERYDYWYQK
jgi:hypothetical protein